MTNNILEGLEFGDLARVVEPAFGVDEYRSKMGEDKDIVVVSFTVLGKEPADDLVSFFEKSYDWILDADMSDGEISDGNYLVFVELERDPKASEHIFAMLTDMMNLTKQKVEEWEFTYYKDHKKLPVTLENLSKKIIKTPEDYERKSEQERKKEALEKVIARAEEHKGEDLTVSENAELNHLRALANVYVQPVKVTDLEILNIQISAGIR